MTRRALARIALALAATTLALGLAEVVARSSTAAPGTFMVLDGATRGMGALLEPDPELVWRTVPGASAVVTGPEFATRVSLNSLGLRGDEPLPDQEGALRLLAIGDSFTLAAQVQRSDTLTARLGEHLATRLRRPVEVLNGGVDGYGTRQAVGVARRVSQRVRLDGVLLLFFTGNDLWENANLDARIQARARGGEDKVRLNPLHALLLNHSRLYARGLAA